MDWFCFALFFSIGKVSQNNRKKEEFTILFGDLRKLLKKPEFSRGSVSKGQLAGINVLDSDTSCPHRETTFL